MFASNMQLFKINNFLLIHTLHAEYLFLLLGNNLMCNLYVYDRILGMSNFMHKLVSIDIHVMCAVKHSFKTGI